MLVVGLAVAMIDGGNFVMALVCIVSYGIANGLKAVQRATLPLALFGRGQFGAYMGRLALPQGIVSASRRRSSRRFSPVTARPARCG